MHEDGRRSKSFGQHMVLMAKMSGIHPREMQLVQAAVLEEVDLRVQL